MSRLAILVPVLRRPHRVAPLLASIAGATPQPHRVVFVADPDDADEVAAIMAAGAGLIVHGGSYASKINAAAAATTERWIFTAADDLAFRDGWLDAALALMRPPVQVVGVNDLGTRRVRQGQHATSFLIDRAYVERGTIDGGRGPMHEGYAHNFPDDELVETARARGVLAFATDSIVEHLHPHFDRAPDDEVYALGRASFAEDRERFRARRPLWA